MPNHGRIITTGSEFGDRSLRAVLCGQIRRLNDRRSAGNRTLAGQGSQTQIDMCRDWMNVWVRADPAAPHLPVAIAPNKNAASRRKRRFV
jgi:hypothetical protein